EEEQPRRGHCEQLVLDHVRREGLLGERLERRQQGRREAREASEVEGEPPGGGDPGVTRGAKAPPAERVRGAEPRQQQGEERLEDQLVQPAQLTPAGRSPGTPPRRGTGRRSDARGRRRNGLAGPGAPPPPPPPLSPSRGKVALTVSCKCYPPPAPAPRGRGGRGKGGRQG